MDMVLFQYPAYCYHSQEASIKPGRGMIARIYSDTLKHSELAHI